MKTVKQLYEAIEVALNDLANKKGIKLEEIKINWIETTNLGSKSYKSFVVQYLDIEGAMYPGEDP